MHTLNAIGEVVLHCLGGYGVCVTSPSAGDLARRVLTPVSVGPSADMYPLWSRDGRRIAFSAGRNGTKNIYLQNADGTGTAERLTGGGRPQFPLAFTADDRGLLLHEPNASPYDLGFADLARNKPSELILHATYNESNGALSSDGKWLTYQSNESGQEEVYVRPFPNIETGRWKVSTGVGRGRCGTGTDGNCSTTFRRGRYSRSRFVKEAR